MKNEELKLEPAGAPERFLRRLDWSAFWTATLVSFAVYFYTMAPTLTLEDSGELATASAYLGVPHPPGYPIWTIITWIFTKLFWFVKFRGQPNPAWAVSLVSAIFGALTTGITAILVCRSGTDMLRGIKRTTEVIGQRAEDAICWTGGVAGGLIFAFTSVNWSQSVINEVYSLGAFFLVLVLFTSYVWIRSPREPLNYMTGLVALMGAVSLLVMTGLLVRNCLHFPDFGDVGLHYVVGFLGLFTAVGFTVYAWKVNPDHRLLYLTAFVFGLGLTNYQVLLLLLVSLALVILLKDVRLFRDFLLAAIPFGFVYLFMRTGTPPNETGFLPPITHPTDAACHVYLILAAAWLVGVYYLLPKGRAVAPTISALLLGLAVYIFMPLASECNPPMNWGYPRTWEGFLHALTRGQYERISPTPIFSMQFVRQLGDYLRDLRGTFTLIIAIIGFLPFTAWSVRFEGRRYRALYASVPLAVLAGILIVVEEYLVPAQMEIPALSAAYRFMTLLIMILAGLGGIIMVAAEMWDLLRSLVGRAPAPVAAGGPGEQPVFDTDIDADSRKWALVTFSAFLVMSVVLVLLASPKGDIQDDFIQRVKFIASHALYAFWVGYGIIFGLAFLDTFLRGNAFVKWAGIAAALCLPLVPILLNSYQPELIRIYGGAEQNGHDFGWQFGNYQLRGSEAIMEETEPQEEPLPNPAFPKEMGTNAVFFGGTDPGRFVPTYMIYGARVREDVKLITQNALADNTYMQVMRDLYGDMIWIPAQEDSARAFQRYVEEVKSGLRPPNAELKIENGRVQVSGALGVMEINGILAQMIFEHNNYKHNFYVEESYVINWMYPYLEPHGLIMKIDPQPFTLTDTMVRNDEDLWDWYVRRLSCNPKFERDVVARKSFSKLRSALAGLYAHRGRPHEAENAFQQARILYPLSPEANFRLVQEVLMNQGRFAEARNLMVDFGRQDPANDRVPEFTNHLARIEGIATRIVDLEAKRRDNKMDINQALDLSESYLQVQRIGDFMSMMNGLISITNLPSPFYYRAGTMLRSAKQYGEMVKALDLCTSQLPGETPPDVYLNIARMYAEAGRMDRMRIALREFLKRQPSDWKAWLDMAYVNLALTNVNEAVQSLSQAVAYGGEEARGTIEQDQRFAPLLSRIKPQQPSGLLNLPGFMPEGNPRLRPR